MYTTKATFEKFSLTSYPFFNAFSYIKITITLKMKENKVEDEKFLFQTERDVHHRPPAGDQGSSPSHSVQGCTPQGFW